MEIPMTVARQRNMMGEIKRFDSAEHNQYDSIGKSAMLKFLDRKLSKHNLKTIENPDRYGIDLLTMNESNIVVHCWEIEVRYGNWQGDISFPFREINCIERKDYQWKKAQEFLDKIPFKMASDFTVSYVQLNRECTRGVIIDSNTILKYPLKAWANRKAANEYVRQVPISETLQIKI
jgi:hypothetical protein